MTENRVTIKINNPNPLFEQWITEWRDQENPHHLKQQFFFNQALDSLKKYPLVLKTGADCMILKGFSKKLCSMLDKKLENHKNPLTEQRKPKPINIKYNPTYRSGPYAILYTLYKNSLGDNSKNQENLMLKDEIIRFAQHYCDKSFSKREAGSFYTAWNSMSTLISKELVFKTGNPAKYSLTEQGKLVAKKIYENHAIENPIEENVIQMNKEETIDLPQLKAVEKPKKTLVRKPSSNSVGSSHGPQNSQSSNTIFNSFVLAPNSFQVLLVVDQHETSGQSGAKNKCYDELIMELNALCVPYEIRHLKIGDYTWICKGMQENEEVVLPFVAERKRMDDFGASIKDGRFHEQKFRLKQCGIPNLIYLVENYGDNKHVGLPLSHIYQAATNTLLQDNFNVKFTESIRSTAHYLNCFTQLLKKQYQNKTLTSCPKENLVDCNLHEDLVPLMTFAEFNAGASKQKALKVKELFIRQLLQLKGVSVDKALAISEKYPCPKMLKEAYDDCFSDKQRENLLSDIEFGSLRKKVGTVISKSIFQFFTFNKY